MSEQIIYDNGDIHNNEWLLLELNDELTIANIPIGKVIVPSSLWQPNQKSLAERSDDIGVLLESDTNIDEIAEQLLAIKLIAINFPVFTDGRGYSIARSLREHYNYKGEIRAVGDVMQDQLYYMRRCGFNSFMLKQGRSLSLAVKALFPFKESYQAAIDQPKPLFRRNIKI